MDSQSDVPRRRATGFRVLLASAAVVVLIAGLKAASSVLLPVLVAAFLAVLAVPPLAWLRKRRLPMWAATLLVFVGVIGAFAAVSLLIGTSIRDFTANIGTYQDAITARTGSVIVWLSTLGVEVSAAAIREQVDASRLMGMFGEAMSAFGNLASDTFFVLLTVVFILAEAAGLPRKIRAAMGDPSADLSRYSGVLEDLQAYLGIKTQVSLVTGVGVGLLVWLTGVDYPFLWGLLAFLLNYVPTLGSIIAAFPPAVLAFIQHGWERALIVVGGILLVNMVMGNVIEPRLMGRRLGLSTLVVFLSLVFWGWIWGPVGMVLCVPLTMFLKILLEANDDTKWLAVLLGSGAEVKQRGADIATPQPEG